MTRGGSLYRVGHGDHPIHRRAVLAAGTGLAAAVLAGCLGSGGEQPDPVSIPENAQCDVCGMVIANHPGPNGQIFYRDQSPEGRDNPAWFCSLKSCFFPYRLEKDRLGWTVAAMYVTDYSSVDYELTTSGGETYISSHLEAETFGPAEDLEYVVGSDVQGAMGPDFYPFSSTGSAEGFAGEHGGRLLRFDDIGPDLVGR